MSSTAIILRIKLLENENVFQSQLSTNEIALLETAVQALLQNDRLAGITSMKPEWYNYEMICKELIAQLVTHVGDLKLVPYADLIERAVADSVGAIKKSLYEEVLEWPTTIATLKGIRDDEEQIEALAEERVYVEKHYATEELSLLVTANDFFSKLGKCIEIPYELPKTRVL